MDTQTSDKGGFANNLWVQMATLVIVAIVVVTRAKVSSTLRLLIAALAQPGAARNQIRDVVPTSTNKTRLLKSMRPAR